MGDTILELTLGLTFRPLIGSSTTLLLMEAVIHSLNVPLSLTVVLQAVRVRDTLFNGRSYSSCSLEGYALSGSRELNNALLNGRNNPQALWMNPRFNSGMGKGDVILMEVRKPCPKSNAHPSDSLSAALRFTLWVEKYRKLNRSLNVGSLCGYLSLLKPSLLLSYQL